MDWPEDQDEMGRIMMRDAAIRDAQKPLEERVKKLELEVYQLKEAVRCLSSKLKCGQR